MVMAWCSTRGIALAVRGGGTGQSGAALTKGLLVNLERHFRYTHLAEDASTIRVGAATTISQIENELNPRGRTLGLDLHVQNRSAGGLFNSQPAVEPSSGTNFIDLISSMTWILPSGQVVKLAPATNDNQNPWPDTLLNTIEPIFSPIRFNNSKMPGPSPSVFPTNGRPWSWLAGTLGKCGAGSEFIIRTRPRHEHIRTLLLSSTSLADLEEQAERLNGLKPTHSILLDMLSMVLSLDTRY
jgi:D-lactate dehydrogenase